MGNFVRLRSRRVLLVLIGLFLLVAGGAFRLHQWRNNPQVAWLESHAGAEWIRADMPFLLTTYVGQETGVLFGTSFDTLEPVAEAELIVRAFRWFEIEMDGKKIYTSPRNTEAWQQAHVVKFPEPLEPGPHFLRVSVFNQGAHACLWLRGDKLGLASKPGWLATVDRLQFSPAVSVNKVVTPELALDFPRVRESVSRLAPALGGLFLVGLCWWGAVCKTSPTEIRLVHWQFGAGAVRWVLIALWIALSVNNIWQIDPRVGYDVRPHFDYVRFITSQRALPLATDGWQMFQSPLFYLLAAPLDAVLRSSWSDDSIIKALRFLPLLCGLAQIELVYRAARAAFPARNDQQILAVLVGGLMPMQIYISQVIGNEPLAGALTSLLVLLCLLVLVEPERRQSPWYFALLGLVWGLALLSKVTPILLAPLVLGTVLFACWTNGATMRGATARVGLLFGVLLATCGWYYFRNMYWIGRPFVGGWDPLTGIAWWQDPSYRTWSRMASFGAALDRPVYAGAWSLWDSLYSTMWLDGFTSGLATNSEIVPWNLDWMIAGAWLAIVPMGLLLSGIAFGWVKASTPQRRVIAFCLAATAIYLAAETDLFVRLPIYSTAKATYMLGLLPCYGLLAAAGAAPWLRFRVFRVLLLAAISCWGAAAYVAYWVR